MLSVLPIMKNRSVKVDRLHNELSKELKRPDDDIDFGKCIVIENKLAALLDKNMMLLEFNRKRA